MSLTVTQARNEMTAMVAAALPVDTIAFDDLPGKVPDTMTSWYRLTIRHSDGEQETLADATGKKRFLRQGLLTVQIFTPVGGGLSIADESVKMILDIFEGKASAGGIWFRNARFREIGAEGDFFQTNVLVDFQYTETK